MASDAPTGLAQNTGGRLKVLTCAVAILLVAACGSSSTAARHSPSPSVSASASAAVAASPSPSATSSTTPSGVASYGVLATFGANGSYSVSLVGANGAVVASATPSAPAQISCPNGAPADLPMPISTTSTRAYFLDGQGNLRFLTPSGETGIATHLATGSQTRSMFAVSPDDRRIAIVFDAFLSSGITTSLLVQDLNGGSNRVDIFSETGAFTLWPVGWHAGDLVVAKVASCTGDGPLASGSIELHVVNPANAARLATVGGPGCAVNLPATPGGVLCENSAYTSLDVLSWNGGTVSSHPIQGPTAAYLSPDGSEVAVVDTSTPATGFLGSKTYLDMLTCGWIDSTHVIAGGDTQSQPRVGDITTATIVPFAAQGTCAGRIPGGL